MMAEGEPRSKKSFHFQYGDQIVYGNNENTRIYTFAEEPLGDHIFIIDTALEDKHVQGSSYWKRHFFENGDSVAWTELYRYLISIGVEVVRDECLSRYDREYYRRVFGEPIVGREIIMPEFRELTPREEAKVEYLGTLLRLNFLTPPDFNGSGDLIIHYN